MTEQPNQQPEQEDVNGQEPNTPPQGDQQPQQQETNTEQVDQSQEGTTEQDDPRIKRANAEAANYRTKLREQEKIVADLQSKYDAMLQGLGKLSGHVPEEGEQVDPDEAIAAATKRAEQAEAKARALEVTSDLRDKASEAGLNSRLLVPLLKGEGKLDNLDPEADDYTSQVEAVIAEAQETYPELKAQVAPRSSGQAPTPTDNSDNKLSPDDLARLYAEGKWDEINKAVSEGRIA